MPELAFSMIMLIPNIVAQDWHTTLASLESAYASYNWKLDQLTGGPNVEAIERWKAEMERWMQPLQGRPWPSMSAR